MLQMENENNMKTLTTQAEPPRDSSQSSATGAHTSGWLQRLVRPLGERIDAAPHTCHEASSPQTIQQPQPATSLRALQEQYRAEYSLPRVILPPPETKSCAGEWQLCVEKIGGGPPVPYYRWNPNPALAYLRGLLKIGSWCGLVKWPNGKAEPQPGSGASARKEPQ